MFTKKILAVGLLAMLAACNATQSPNPQNPKPTTTEQKTVSANLQQQWKLIEFQKFSAKDLAQTTLDLRELPRAHATVGCNQMNFQAATSAPNTWNVNNIAMTRMYCQDLAKLENAFAQNIQAAKIYRIENNNLILQTPNGETMKFVAVL